ncbi:type II toxin-antitoxin system CcdA family antitoxin [Methanoregula boonei]|uniref:type II toxin-antitoxin system CcdA family antitoxin n=1 Tax=Methanoregula boonei TaxID=358766 RepID=UPI00064F222C
MVTVTIGKDGIEYIHTNVSIPRQLRDLAKELGVSMSQELRTALEKKVKEGYARGQNAPITETTACLSSTDNQVEQECSGVEQAPTSQPAAPSSTPRRSKGQ